MDEKASYPHSNRKLRGASACKQGNVFNKLDDPLRRIPGRVLKVPAGFFFMPAVK